MFFFYIIFFFFQLFALVLDEWATSFNNWVLLFNLKGLQCRGSLTGLINTMGVVFSADPFPRAMWRADCFHSSMWLSGALLQTLILLPDSHVRVHWRLLQDARFAPVAVLGMVDASYFVCLFVCFAGVLRDCCCHDGRPITRPAAAGASVSATGLCALSYIHKHKHTYSLA